MEGSALLFLIIIVILALLFDYINGFHDAANAIATVVATKIMTPRTAVIYGAILNFVGALLGTEVAATVGKGLVHLELIDNTMDIVFCALIGAILWNLITWYKGLPSSSSHALIGSLLGAAFFSRTDGWTLIDWEHVLGKVIIPMFTSPVAGFVLGMIIMTGITWVVYRVHLHHLNKVFGKLQILSAGVMALSHGHNDAQKSMGIIALALVTFNNLPAEEFKVPLWVIVSCATMMAMGTMSGGWKIIHTLGNKMIKLQPIHGFAAETTASTVIMAASEYGIPLSTTHVITSAIMGVGATKRLSAVKWTVVGNIMWAWVLTIPITFIFTGALMSLFVYLKGLIV